MAELEIKTYPVGMLRTNCYIIHLKDKKEAILFDPGDDADYLISKLTEDNLKVKGILLTHGHFDHIHAVAKLKETFRTSVYAHENEKELLEDEKINCSAEFRRPVILSPDILIRNHEELELAEIKIRCIHTPGHTKGSVCYLLPEYKVMISGDMLFYETVGATHFPTGNAREMDHSLNQILMKLEDDIVVYPGHGETTTIGHERKYNPFVTGNEEY